MKGDFPGQDKEAKKAGEEAYETARAKAQSLVSLSEVFRSTATLLCHRGFANIC